MLTSHNYPAGTIHDPAAPFNLPEASAECDYDHPDGETCQGVAELTCECGAACCSEAIVTLRLSWEGTRFDIQCCEECAMRRMVPHSPEQAVICLNRAMNHQTLRPGLSLNEYVGLMDTFTNAVGDVVEAMAQKSREHTEAVLRLARVA